MKARALIFDMDGTMIDSMGHHRQSWIAFAKSHALEIAVDDLMRRTTGRTGVECMAELFGRAMTHDEAWTLVQQKERLYRDAFAAEFREVAGFKAFARDARSRGFKLGVGTAGDAYNIAFALERLALDEPPQAVVGGDEGFPGKPEPAIFLEVARRLRIEPAHCIVFEDAPLGIEAARRAGMRAVAVCTTHDADELAGPHVLAAIGDYHGLADAVWLRPLMEASHHASASA